ncbi:MAG TPA: hypothetical protein VKA39_09240, partial [Beijerinckiaceae bacterium]|nr:hypothetical protein [Beijerinckiaceae bacterium]
MFHPAGGKSIFNPGQFCKSDRSQPKHQKSPARKPGFSSSRLGRSAQAASSCNSSASAAFMRRGDFARLCSMS